MKNTKKMQWRSNPDGTHFPLLSTSEKKRNLPRSLKLVAPDSKFSESFKEKIRNEFENAREKLEEDTEKMKAKENEDLQSPRGEESVSELPEGEEYSENEILNAGIEELRKQGLEYGADYHLTEGEGMTVTKTKPLRKEGSEEEEPDWTEISRRKREFRHRKVNWEQ